MTEVVAIISIIVKSCINKSIFFCESTLANKTLKQSELMIVKNNLHQPHMQFAWIFLQEQAKKLQKYEFGV